MRSWAQQQDERLQIQAASLAAEREEVARLMDWITAAEESLDLRDQEPLPEDSEQLEELNCQHVVTRGAFPGSTAPTPLPLPRYIQPPLGTPEELGLPHQTTIISAVS